MSGTIGMAGVVAALSVVSDLARGHPSGEAMRASLVATELARRAGLDERDQGEVYYGTLLDRVTDDVDWSTDAAIESAPWYGARHGKDGVADFFGAIGKTGPVTEFTPLAFAGNDDGDVMVAAETWTFCGVSSAHSTPAGPRLLTRRVTPSRVTPKAACGERITACSSRCSLCWAST